MITNWTRVNKIKDLLKDCNENELELLSEIIELEYYDRKSYKSKYKQHGTEKL